MVKTGNQKKVRGAYQEGTPGALSSFVGPAYPTDREVCVSLDPSPLVIRPLDRPQTQASAAITPGEGGVSEGPGEAKGCAWVGGGVFRVRVRGGQLENTNVESKQEPALPPS